MFVSREFFLDVSHEAPFQARLLPRVLNYVVCVWSMRNSFLSPRRLFLKCRSNILLSRMTSFPSIIGGDAPMSMIHDHLENPHPFTRTESAARNYSCRPTPLSYRVLKNPKEPCPLEANLDEPGPSVCCTSRRTGDQSTDPESLEYLRIINIVFRQIPPANRARIPLGFKRVMKWVQNLMSSPEIPNTPGTVVRIGTQHPQFFNIVKLVLVTASTAHVRAQENNTDLAIVQGGNSMFFNSEFSRVNPGLLSVANEVGLQRALFFPAAFTPTTPTSPFHPVRAEYTRVTTLPGPMAPIDLAEVVNHFEIANMLGWKVHNLIVEHPTVVGATTSTIAQCRRLIQAFKAGNGEQSVRIRISEPNDDVVAPGFSPVNIDPDDMLEFVTTLANSVDGIKLEANPMHSYYFEFSFVDSVGINRTRGIVVEYWAGFPELYFYVKRI